MDKTAHNSYSTIFGFLFSVCLGKHAVQCDVYPPEEGSLLMFLMLCTTTLYKHLRMGSQMLVGGTAVVIRSSCMLVEVYQLLLPHP